MTVIDNFSTGYREFVAPRDRLRVVEGDLLDERERAPGVAGQQHALCERGGGVQVDGRRRWHRRRL